MASRKRSGGSWGSIRDVSSLSGVGTLDQAAVAVNVADARVATWRRNTGSTLVIQSADGTEDSDTWTAPVPVSVAGPDTTSSAQDARVSIETGAREVAVWLQKDGTADLFARGASRPPGGAWSTPMPLSALDETVTAGTISLASGGGESTAVWASGGVVQARTLSTAGTWGSVTNLSDVRGRAPADPGRARRGRERGGGLEGVRRVLEGAGDRSGRGCAGAGRLVGARTAYTGQTVAYSVTPRDWSHGHRPLGLRGRHDGHQHLGEPRLPERRHLPGDRHRHRRSGQRDRQHAVRHRGVGRTGHRDPDTHPDPDPDADSDAHPHVRQSRSSPG